MVEGLAGKVCVVNGAASLIGQAVAERFAREGAVVVGVDKVEHSVGHHSVQADLAQEVRVQEMYEEIVREHGRLDVIHNNMGLMNRSDGSALDISLQTWRNALDANLTSVFLTCKHAIPNRRVAASSTPPRSSPPPPAPPSHSTAASPKPSPSPNNPPT